MVFVPLSSHFNDSNEFFDEENENNKQTDSACAISIADFIRNTLKSVV